MRATICERCGGWGCRWCRIKVPVLAKIVIPILYASMIGLVALMLGVLASATP